MNKILCLAIIASLAISAYGACTSPAVSINVAGVKTIATDCAATCFAGYKMSGAVTTSDPSATCLACGAGLTSATGNAGTTCTDCTINNYCPAQTGGTADSSPVACPAGFFCPAAASAPTPCPATKASDVSKGAETDCVAHTGTAIPGCRSYPSATATTCASALEGYATITPGTPIATPIACAANCKTCVTDNTVANCSAAKDGFFINIADVANKKIDACEAGCQKCAYDATTTNTKKNKCTHVKAGYKLVADQPVMCEAGKGSAEGNATADCAACTAAKNCATCSTVDLCKSCVAKHTFDAAASTCTAFDQTKKHPSCGDASGDKADNCQSCDAAHFRELEWDTTVSPPVYKAVGKCNCKPMYYDKSTAVPADYICGKCPDNATSCTWTAAGGVDNVKCATGFTLAGKLICAKPEAASTPTGFALDTSVTPAVFKACFASCTACTGVLATQCTACADKDAKYVAPTSTDAAYAQAFVGAKRGLINNTCFDACPAGFAADSARTGCVAASSSSTGVFAIFALIASLFIIF